MTPGECRGLRAFLHVLVLAIVGTLLLGSCARGEQPGLESPSRRGSPALEREDAGARVPARALTVYQQVLRTGHAPIGHVGGRVFENRERKLPARGDYHEYDVNPRVSGRNRGPERIVVDLDTGRGWYTGDHYRSFIPIERSERGR